MLVSLLDGQVDLPVVPYAYDLDLHRLSILDIVVNVVHKGIGDLRDVYQSALAFRQGHKCAELCDARDLAFDYHSHLKLHMCSLSPCI